MLKVAVGSTATSEEVVVKCSPTVLRVDERPDGSARPDGREIQYACR